MALASWCTPEQNAWFASCLANFHQACLNNTVGTFFTAAMKAFMAWWLLPECAETIVGNSPEDVTKRAEQNMHYQRRKRQIEARFNNNHSKACLAATNATSGKSLTTSPKKKIIYSLQPLCHLHAIQIYSQRYYKNRVQASVKKAIRQSRLNPLTHGQKLAIINKLTHETFQAKSEEVKTEIFDALEQLHEEQAEASHKGLWKPEDYLDAIDATPAVLKCFLDDLAVQTGWWFMVIAGGPDPADRGNIRMGSFHVGINGHKQNFEDEYTHHSVDPTDSSAHHTTFEEGVIAPYGQFLKTLFSCKVRAQQACNQADINALADTIDDNKCEAMPELSGLLSMPRSPVPPPNPSLQPPSTLTQSPPDLGLVDSPPIPSFQPSSNVGLISPSIPSLELPSTMPASILNHSVPTSTSTHSPPNPGLVFPPVSSFQLEFMLQPSESHEEVGGDELDPQLFWQDASFGGHAALDPEDESFPFTSGAMFGEVNAVGDDQVDLGIPGEQHPYPQPELKGSPLPLLPNHIDEHKMEGDLPSPSSMPATSFSTDFDGDLMPVQMRWKRHNRVVDGNEGQQEDSAMVGYCRQSSTSLIVILAVLEAQISQSGSLTKGRLGTITARPSSLSIWLQNRHYNVYLQLPPSFSAEFLAWWNALQPNW
ncbi:hypothetical protein EDD18DRAFT_1108478 [Armillaria luteobubalina]|uniref:Uncharacterized protein n=1 Tax=Armillaria luteobubalina TaxID=153913 RepID=A0AA39ULF5_9AGAR|nr:hypothetical protein EDD18DRAFT_1108478 [Armillaria luteobubalina]